MIASARRREFSREVGARSGSVEEARRGGSWGDGVEVGEGSDGSWSEGILGRSTRDFGVGRFRSFSGDELGETAFEPGTEAVEAWFRDVPRDPRRP